jgi:MoaA/NifB/PqqE/SkfB family radical SAM enzyme
MVSFGIRTRDRFRAFPLDGALLFFQPSSGTSLRIENGRTQSFRRQAPRVVMFGITNHCNLRCSFCSRDTARASAWTVATAAELLRKLAAAGTLEVAFGGGEPFTFRGFHELLSELHTTTPLALHVTTNGTLLDAPTFAPFRGLLGQVRVSIYDDERWRVAARTLRDAGQLWGANVLVDDRRLPALPALLAQLAALGCHDVSLLSYVGGDPLLQLSVQGRERLASLIADAPLSCRISVCFGARLPAPRLFDGMDGTGDCGAGYDFVSIAPDQRVQSCSFQDGTLPAATAEQILDIWRSRRAYLAQATQRQGCARRLPQSEPATRRAPPPVAVWRGFSGNNSGECILVGKFESSEEARRYMAELQPSWAPDGDYSAEWRALFERENVLLARARDDGELSGRSPSTLLALGRSVVALSYDADDAFPELRALTWKRAGFVVPGGIHLHESPSLLGAIRCHDADDARSLLTLQHVENFGCKLYLHGDVVFAHIPNATGGRESSFEQSTRHLESLAQGRPLGAELVLDEWDDAAFVSAKQRLGAELEATPRLLAVFHGDTAADASLRFATSLTETTARAYAGCVLLEGLSRRKRAAVLALRQGATVSALDGREVDVQGHFWFLDPPREKGKKAEPASIDVAALGRELSEAVGKPVHSEPGPSWRVGAQARVTTSEPQRALGAMEAAANRLGARLNPWVSDVDPLAFLLRRLLSDVRG